jgi:hypothetical protein
LRDIDRLLEHAAKDLATGSGAPRKTAFLNFLKELLNLGRELGAPKQLPSNTPPDLPTDADEILDKEWKYQTPVFRMVRYLLPIVAAHGIEAVRKSKLTASQQKDAEAALSAYKNKSLAALSKMLRRARGRKSKSRANKPELSPTSLA